jgi:hypothetical protein
MRSLPSGVRLQKGRFVAGWKQAYLGMFGTVEEAVLEVEKAKAASPKTRRPNPPFKADADIKARLDAMCWVPSTNGRGHLNCVINRKTVQMGNMAWSLYGGQPPAEGQVVDHINRDPSDNRRENLRLVTLKGNALNKASRVFKKKNRWVVRVGKGGCLFHRFYEDKETAELVLKHIKQKLIERETVCTLTIHTEATNGR